MDTTTQKQKKKFKTAPSDIASPTFDIDDAPIVLPLTQRLTLSLGGNTIAHARWFAPDSGDGVFQLLDIFVDPLHQRQGHGSRLLRQTYDHATTSLKVLGIKPRRIWVSVEQKRHVIARAFLSKHGFQHVATMQKLYVGQDAMIYSRSFD